MLPSCCHARNPCNSCMDCLVLSGNDSVFGLRESMLPPCLHIRPETLPVGAMLYPNSLREHPSCVRLGVLIEACKLPPCWSNQEPSYRLPNPICRRGLPSSDHTDFGQQQASGADSAWLACVALPGYSYSVTAPLLSQDRLKLWTSNSAVTITGSILTILH